MEYKKISAEPHVDIPCLPEDLFVSNAPERFKEHMPRVEDSSKGKVWKVDGQVLGHVVQNKITCDNTRELYRFG